MLRRMCGCVHTLGWHYPVLPSNVDVRALTVYGPGPCRHPTCECKKFSPVPLS